MAAYLGFNGWCLGVELRPGSRHGQKGITAFWGEMFAAETFCALQAAKGVHFVVRWNPRGTNPLDWLEQTLDHGEEESGHRDGVRSRRVVRVTLMEMNEHGRHLIASQIHIEGWWTDFPDPAVEVIRLYRDHRGSEQFYSEFKTDLDLKRLPSKYFRANALVLSLGGLTSNLLRLLGQKSLSGGYGPRRSAVKRHRAHGDAGVDVGSGAFHPARPSSAAALR